MWLDTVMLALGYVKLPKAKPGMVVVKPVLRRNPVRKPHLEESEPSAKPLPGQISLPEGENDTSL
jgi:hypothetical protein